MSYGTIDWGENIQHFNTRCMFSYGLLFTEHKPLHAYNQCPKRDYIFTYLAVDVTIFGRGISLTWYWMRTKQFISNKMPSIAFTFNLKIPNFLNLIDGTDLSGWGKKRRDWWAVIEPGCQLWKMEYWSYIIFYSLCYWKGYSINILFFFALSWHRIMDCLCWMI